MTEHTHSFGYWLRRRRRALDLTQEQLAAAVACSHFAIRKIEADERRPSKALAERLATRLEIAAEERDRFVAAARGIRGADALAVASQPIPASSQPVPPSSQPVQPSSQPVPPSSQPVPPSSQPVPVRNTPDATARDKPDPDRSALAQPPAGSKFVGRRAELTLLTEALARAQAGQAQVVMLAGHPGIGKTRTAQELAARAASAGMEVLWGRCPEEPGAPPYWPWVHLLRAYFANRPQIDPATLFGASARWIAELVPELRQGGSAPAGADTTDAAQARFLLFDAVTAFLKRATGQHGMMLVIDDLHWAEAASLRLLEFIAADAAQAPLLVLGTYRDIEVDRRHALFNTLGELARRPHYLRIALGGLSLDEARELVADTTANEASLMRLHEQTEGNPFYLAEMAHLLSAPGAARNNARLPAGVREAIGSRLNRLSPSCYQVLTNAAAIGREFELTVLLGMTDELNAAQFEDAIEEALEANVIEELIDADAYRFSHALIRETLYEELSAIRRPRLHHRAAVAIESVYRHDLRSELSRLAFHYGAAMAVQGADKALEFARRAGEHALHQLAYEEAARHFRGALDAFAIQARHIALDPALRCELLTLQGEAQTFAADYANARDTLRAAADLAMAGGSAAALARLAIAFEDASWRPGLSGEESIGLLHQALARLEASAEQDADPLVRARVLSALTRALIFTGAHDEAFATYDNAVRTARQGGDPSTLAQALCAGLSARWEPERLAERLAAAQEAIAIGRRIGDRGRVLEATSWLLFDRMESGLDDAFWREYDEFAALSNTMRQPFFVYTCASFRPALALMRGELAASERFTNELRELGERQHGLDAAGVYATQMFTLRREQGQLRGLAPLVQHFAASTDAAQRWRPGLALVYAELGMAAEARNEFDVLARAAFAGLARDGMWVASIAYLAEVCVFLRDATHAPVLYRLLLPYEQRNVLAGTSVACFGAASRFLGMLASIEQRWLDAERHFQDAIAMNARQGATTWLAHAEYEYARMLTARGNTKDRAKARALRDKARQATRAIGLVALEEKLEQLG